MPVMRVTLLVAAIIGCAAAQFRAFPGGRKASEDFDCPEDFGYYSHPTDCSKYFVCVFGGALEESCTAGLVYSDELLTCDWPRNVQSCGDPASNTPRSAISTVRVTDPRTAQTPRLSSTSSSVTSSTSSSGGRAAPSRRPSSQRRTQVLNSIAETSRGRSASPSPRRASFSRSRARGSSRSSSRASSTGSSSSSSGASQADTSGSSSIAERVRLLDNIDTRPLDLERGFEGDNNKIVTRRQQKLLSPNSSSGRGRFQQPAQQSLQDNDSRAKGTDAPVRLSTLSSFSFGDTGTRFPGSSTPAPSSLQTTERTRFPPREQSSSSTFVGSTRSPALPSSARSSLIPSTQSSVSRQTVSTSSKSSSSSKPTSQSFTEPAYVAYVNDTIYDVYYIYDDDDLVYDDDYVDDDVAAGEATSSASSPSTPRSKTSPRSEVSRAPATSARRVRTRKRQRVNGAGARKPLQSLRHRASLPSKAAIPRRTSLREPSSRGKPSTSEVTSTRGSSTLGSSFGSSRATSPRGTSNLSTLRASSSSTLVPAGRQTSTSRGSSSSSSSSRPSTSKSRASTERGRTSFVRPSASSSSRATSSVRTPSTGLKSIDSGSGRRTSSLFPKQTSNNVVSTKKPKKVNIWEHPPRRPSPTYPQPEPDQPAERCDARCRLPDCSCGGTATPGGFEAKSTPQLVLLTFDDSINDINKELYGEMFEVGRENPNGCPISATFYLSHEWTDYAQVQNLYANGHEMASHSISHSFGEQFSTSKWEDEIAGQREIIAAYGGVRLDDVRGMRAPFLSIGGNRMFKMLYNNNFTYDSSMPVYENNPPSWPYTLDYSLHHDCMIPPCPNKAYPGVWEVPMVMWQDLSGGRCSMVDACTSPDTAEGVYKMMIKNFERHYTTNRAIFPLYFHAAWMTTDHHKEGFMAFLDTISKMEDVWLVTNWQALQWMRDPQSLSTVNSFGPFGCDYSDRPRCTKPKKCNLWHKSGVRYMTTCQPCPSKYPWTGNTGVAQS